MGTPWFVAQSCSHYIIPGLLYIFLSCPYSCLVHFLTTCVQLALFILFVWILARLDAYLWFWFDWFIGSPSPNLSHMLVILYVCMWFPLPMFQESIPISLSTSPIPLEKISDVVPRSSRDISSLHGNPEASGLDAALRKKRWRKKKPKRKESSADSTSEEEEGTESEKSLEEKRKVLTSKWVLNSPDCQSA